MSSVDQELPDIACSKCYEYIQKGFLSDSRSLEKSYALSKVVHQDCLECQLSQPSESRLCDLCTHIRLGHLLTCKCVGDIFDDHANSQFSIWLGTPRQLQSRHDCAFCAWCLRVARADAQLREYTIDEEKPIHIMRRICIERKDPSLVEVRPGMVWQPETILYIQSKAFRFLDNSVNPQYVKLGYIKGNATVHDDRASLPKEMIHLNESDKFHFGQSTVDWSKIHRWKAVCENQHQACIQRQTGEFPANFRLIDIERHCVVDVDANFKSQPSFVALSYVWGPNPSNEISAQRDNLASLQEPSGLRDLPRTISHAVDACRCLGQRYLWVDRLCIVQDDKLDKYGQIRSLEAIYSRADLVIIAACGDNIQSGLSGIHAEFPRNDYQIPNDIFGFSMANKLHNFGKAMQSTWNERGWTYQEAVLARRKLYFTPAEVWFECIEGAQRENTFSEDWREVTTVGNPLRVSNKVGSASDDFEEYGRHLERYSRRILTYPSDVYHAFNGLEDAFYPGRRTLFGLPESDFNRALLWYPYDWPGLQERACDDQDLTLPSWSWASLIGHITFSSIYGENSRRSPTRQKGSFYCSLVKWARWDETAEKSLRRVDNSNENKVWDQLDDIWFNAKSTNAFHPDFDRFDGEPDYRQFLAAAWSAGCIEADVPHDLLVARDHPAMSAINLKLRWPTLVEFWAEVSSRASTLLISRVGESSLDQISAGVLFTRAQWSPLRVEHDGHDEHLRGDIYVPNAHFVIRDAHGKVIGAVLGTVEYKLRRGTAAESAANVDFLALSVGCIPECLTRNMDLKTLEKNRFHAGQSRSSLSSNQPGIAVMAVRWDGAGSQVARRMAIGWITLQGWADSKPRFRTVYLK